MQGASQAPRPQERCSTNDLDDTPTVIYALQTKLDETLKLSEHQSRHHAKEMQEALNDVTFHSRRADTLNTVVGTHEHTIASKDKELAEIRQTVKRLEYEAELRRNLASDFHTRASQDSRPISELESAFGEERICAQRNADEVVDLMRKLADAERTIQTALAEKEAEHERESVSTAAHLSAARQKNQKLKQDLARRDLKINALELQLNARAGADVATMHATKVEMPQKSKQDPAVPTRPVLGLLTPEPSPETKSQPIDDVSFLRTSGVLVV